MLYFNTLIWVPNPSMKTLSAWISALSQLYWSFSQRSRSTWMALLSLITRKLRYFSPNKVNRRLRGSTSSARNFLPRCLTTVSLRQVFCWQQLYILQCSGREVCWSFLSGQVLPSGPTLLQMAFIFLSGLRGFSDSERTLFVTQRSVLLPSRIL